MSCWVRGSRPGPLAAERAILAEVLAMQTVLLNFMLLSGGVAQETDRLGGNQQDRPAGRINGREERMHRAVFRFRIIAGSKILLAEKIPAKERTPLHLLRHSQCTGSRICINFASSWAARPRCRRPVRAPQSLVDVADQGWAVLRPSGPPRGQLASQDQVRGCCSSYPRAGSGLSDRSAPSGRISDWQGGALRRCRSPGSQVLGRHFELSMRRRACFCLGSTVR